MNFEFVPDGKNWILTQGERPIAQMVMDYLDQLDEVVLLPNITPDETLNVLRVAFFHAYNYVVRRTYSTGILNVTYRGDRDRSESARLLREAVNSHEAADLDAKKLAHALARVGIKIIVAEVENLTEALEAVVSNPRLSVPVAFSMGSSNTLKEEHVTFTVEHPMQFKGWHNVGKPNPESTFDLHIVPAYHPSQDASKHSAHMINGHTDALIGGQAIRYVSAPVESVDDFQMLPLSGTWEAARHPYYITGSQVRLNVSPTQALSAKGLEEILSVLLAMLELEDTFLDVSGGFRDLYNPEAFNRGKLRGSEGFNIWAYLVLEKEGGLDSAYIPGWFHPQEWIRSAHRLAFQMR